MQFFSLLVCTYVLHHLKEQAKTPKQHAEVFNDCSLSGMQPEHVACASQGYQHLGQQPQSAQRLLWMELSLSLPIKPLGSRER